MEKKICEMCGALFFGDDVVCPDCDKEEQEFLEDKYPEDYDGNWESDWEEEQ